MNANVLRYTLPWYPIVTLSLLIEVMKTVNMINFFMIVLLFAIGVQLCYFYRYFNNKSRN